MCKPFYTRIALLGVAMYLTIELIILVATLTLLPSSDLWYPLLVGGLALTVGILIYLWHPWGLVVGVLTGLVGILFSIDSLGANLSSPDSFFDFAYRPVIWAGGTVLVLGGSLAGLVQYFRHRTSTTGPASVVRAAQGLIGVVIFVSLFSAVLTMVGIDRVSADDRVGAMTVTISGWDFSTDALTVDHGGPAKIVFENHDANVHTFTVDGLGLDVKLGPLGDTLVVLDAPPPGSYAFRCRIPGHDKMRGTLTVE